MGSFVQEYVLASLSSVLYGAGVAVVDLRIELDDGAGNNDCTNAKEDREHVYRNPTLSQPERYPAVRH